MLKSLRLFLARRNLKHALKHEEMLRESAEYMRKVILPQREEQLRRREIDVLVAAHLKAQK